MKQCSEFATLAAAELGLVRSMTRIALAILLLATGLAQTSRASDDKAAIRATIADYIERYYLSDDARMERSLHSHFLKHTIRA